MNVDHLLTIQAIFTGLTTVIAAIAAGVVAVISARIKLLEKNTNGMKDELIRTTRDHALEVGKQIGRREERRAQKDSDTHDLT